MKQRDWSHSNCSLAVRFFSLSLHYIQAAQKSALGVTYCWCIRGNKKSFLSTTTTITLHYTQNINLTYTRQLRVNKPFISTSCMDHVFFELKEKVPWCEDFLSVSSNLRHKTCHMQTIFFSGIGLTHHHFYHARPLRKLNQKLWFFKNAFELWIVVLEEK